MSIAVAIAVIGLLGYGLFRFVVAAIRADIARRVDAETTAEQQRMVDHANQVRADNTSPDSWH